MSDSALVTSGAFEIRPSCTPSVGEAVDIGGAWPTISESRGRILGPDIGGDVECDCEVDVSGVGDCEGRSACDSAWASGATWSVEGVVSPSGRVNASLKSSCKSTRKRSKLPSGGIVIERAVSLTAGGGVLFLSLAWLLLFPVPLLASTAPVSAGPPAGPLSLPGFDVNPPNPFSPRPMLKARAISASINSRASVGTDSSPPAPAGGTPFSSTGVAVPEGTEGRKPRRSRMVPQACLIRSARLVAEMSGAIRGGKGGGGYAGTGGIEIGDGGGGLGCLCGGASPDDRIGSDDPVSREAAVAAAATLRKDKGNEMI